MLVYTVITGILIFLISAIDIHSQESALPGSGNSNFINKIEYDQINNIYKFIYIGKDCTIEYKYDIERGYSFNGIKVSFKDYSFYPSYYGGVSIKDSYGREYYSWSDGVEFENKKIIIGGNYIATDWIMKTNSNSYFHFRFNIKISGKTLIINLKDLGMIDPNYRSDYSNCFSIQLDRCEDAISPVIVKIPYLTTFGILYSNDLFTSMFFDWNKTNSSQIYPENKIFSSSSVYYSQNAAYFPKTDGKYNAMEETIYLTCSPEITETFPNIPNPVSGYKNISMRNVVFDNWDEGFSRIHKRTRKLINNDCKNLWLIIHNWQNGGYDNKLPEVLPSNSDYGGDSALKSLSNYCRSKNILFSLHENYTDFYTNGIYFKNEDVGLTPDGEFIKAWKNKYGQSYLMKPSRINQYINDISSKVKMLFNTNASFIDVKAARNPSDYIDYDYRVQYAGMFKGTYENYKNVGNTLRKIHRGPVSSEGYNHFLYIGYFDDIAPQIETTDPVNSSGKSGYYLPLIVDFDLLKMHEKAMVHGLGYLERFFLKDNYWQHMGRSKDSLLIYTATEIAYGHGGFIQSNSYNYEVMANIEYNYVYPLQLLYGNSKVKKIIYHNNGKLYSLSEYIKAFPYSFDKFNSKDFLSQAIIEYENGLKIYVNRHPSRQWRVNSGNKNLKGWFNFHAVINNKKKIKKTVNNPGEIILPSSSGWFCYSPNKPTY
ncbi:MAG: hypothetical protein HGGPFJEG_02237 [Ignavibacteria bacterium]|nr:hypothetical protein [Ignavibacteria bacterium]